jgi:hypothetical protein
MDDHRRTPDRPCNGEARYHGGDDTRETRRAQLTGLDRSMSIKPSYFWVGDSPILGSLLLPCRDLLVSVSMTLSHSWPLVAAITVATDLPRHVSDTHSTLPIPATCGAVLVALDRFRLFRRSATPLASLAPLARGHQNSGYGPVSATVHTVTDRQQERVGLGSTAGS